MAKEDVPPKEAYQQSLEHRHGKALAFKLNLQLEKPLAKYLEKILPAILNAIVNGPRLENQNSAEEKLLRSHLSLLAL
jgi:hypothetical protein